MFMLFFMTTTISKFPILNLEHETKCLAQTLASETVVSEFVILVVTLFGASTTQQYKFCKIKRENEKKVRSTKTNVLRSGNKALTNATNMSILSLK